MLNPYTFHTFESEIACLVAYGRILDGDFIHICYDSGLLIDESCPEMSHCSCDSISIYEINLMLKNSKLSNVEILSF